MKSLVGRSRNGVDGMRAMPCEQGKRWYNHLSLNVETELINVVGPHARGMYAKEILLFLIGKDNKQLARKVARAVLSARELPMEFSRLVAEN
jgi:hypothetical protein